MSIGSSTLLEDVELVADGLSFPEGPTVLPDGSLLVVEIRRGQLTRIGAGGEREVVARPGGGPNGLALGPDGAVYVCNNGGTPEEYSGGRIERVDLERGSVEVLYDACAGRPLCGPNDLVFDADGGFWFTDTGKFRERDRDFGGLYHAWPDGSGLTEVVPRLDAPNGVGLSPDGGTVYWAETISGRLYGRRITGTGAVEHTREHDPETLRCGLPGVQMFDSLAVCEDGTVVVGTLISGCITEVSPDGAVTQYSLPAGFEDSMPTNLCFAGPDRRTAYITLSDSGRVIRCRWPRPGLRLHGSSP